MTVTERLGEVLRDADGVRLEFVRTYDVPPTDVWSAVTDPERMERWIGRWTGDPATGRVEFVMSAAGSERPETVLIHDCSAPTHLAMTLESRDGPWPLELTLTDQGDRTVLRFVHQLAEPYNASTIGPVWQNFLDRLDSVLVGAPAPDDFGAYVARFGDAYAIPSA
ncbi:MAG TPA: SRPBCC domain-containing protein [Frankiaceae bacterium]|nr:SRPBCC domain-containing protein [Frankiaceae bacterium]